MIRWPSYKSYFLLQIMNKRQILLLFCSVVLILSHSAAHSQDTLKINLTEFLERGLDRSGQVAYESRSVDLARNRTESARGQRILPSINLSTQHGVIPGVTSNTDLPEGQFYLDPNLSNDWEDWAIFTRAELNAVQPIYSWGAIDSAIKAAEAGAKAAEYQFDAFRSEAKLQLYELYYSYLLSLEISRIMDDAEGQLRQVSRRLNELLEEGDPDLKESDMFKFEILETEFEIQKTEVNQSADYVRRVWNYILAEEDGVVYAPTENFLDPVAFELENYDYYEQLALQSRPELRGVESGIEAARNGIDAVKSQQYPMLFLGITGSFANTPNRPRQTNPFIINSTNYASAGVGIGIRQNLNFFSMRRSVERAEIEHRRVNDLRNAVHDGIILDLNDLYREAVIAEKKVQQTEAALNISRNWVRNEQLNYDIGFGDAEDLLDAIQKELELRVDLKQNIFELNKKIAALYKGAGIPIENLSIN